MKFKSLIIFLLCVGIILLFIRIAEMTFEISQLQEMLSDCITMEDLLSFSHEQKKI